LVGWIWEAATLIAATITAIEIAKSVDCSPAGFASVVAVCARLVDLLHVICLEYGKRHRRSKRRVWMVETVSTPGVLLNLFSASGW